MRIRRKVTIILSLKFPLHLKCVAALPYELQMKVDGLANVEGKVDKVMENVASVHISVWMK